MEQSNRLVECPHCNKPFDGRGLWQHIRKVHPEEFKKKQETPDEVKKTRRPYKRRIKPEDSEQGKTDSAVLDIPNFCPRCGCDIRRIAFLLTQMNKTE